MIKFENKMASTSENQYPAAVQTEETTVDTSTQTDDIPSLFIVKRDEPKSDLSTFVANSFELFSHYLRGEKEQKSLQHKIRSFLQKEEEKGQAGKQNFQLLNAEVDRDGIFLTLAGKEDTSEVSQKYRMIRYLNFIHRKCYELNDKPTSRIFFDDYAVFGDSFGGISLFSHLSKTSKKKEIESSSPEDEVLISEQKYEGSVMLPIFESEAENKHTEQVCGLAISNQKLFSVDESLGLTSWDFIHSEGNLVSLQISSRTRLQWIPMAGFASLLATDSCLFLVAGPSCLTLGHNLSTKVSSEGLGTQISSAYLSNNRILFLGRENGNLELFAEGLVEPWKLPIEMQFKVKFFAPFVSEQYRNESDDLSLLFALDVQFNLIILSFADSEFKLKEEVELGYKIHDQFAGHIESNDTVTLLSVELLPSEQKLLLILEAKSRFLVFEQELSNQYFSLYEEARTKEKLRFCKQKHHELSSFQMLINL